MGVDVSVIIARTIHPGSDPAAWPFASVPWMRKSFLTYWFSLKTPLRDGRSATQPEPANPAKSSVPKKAVRTSSNVFMAKGLSCEDMITARG